MSSDEPDGYPAYCRAAAVETGPVARRGAVVWRWSRSLAGGVVDLFLPPVCLLCGADVEARPSGLCARCTSGIEPTGANGCCRCGASRTDAGGACQRCEDLGWPFEAGVVIGRYSGSLREAILAFKYGGIRTLGRPLAELLEREIRRRDLHVGLDGITPVPLHPRRLRARGFNQAMVIGEELAWGLHRPLRRLGLERRRDSVPQVSLEADARRRQVEGAFEVRPSRLARLGGRGKRRALLAAGRDRPRVILLVDDVITTGATIGACARALRESMGAEIRVAALASSV